jgi:hypothetical protein
MARRLLMVGFKSEAVRQEYLAMPTAPSNYGPEAAARHIAKKREETLAESNEIPIIATLTDVLIADEAGKQLCRFQSRTSAEVAKDLFMWCNNNLPTENLYCGAGGGGGVPMFGFRLRTMLEIGALECLAAHPKVPINFHLWRSATFIHDLYEYILPTDIRKMVGLAGLCRFLLNEPVEERSLYQDVDHQVKLGMKLLDRVYLLNPPSPRPMG